MLNGVPTLVPQKKKPRNSLGENKFACIIVAGILFVQCVLIYYILQPIDRSILSFLLILFWPIIVSILVINADNWKNKTSISHTLYYTYGVTICASVYFLISFALQVATRGKSWEDSWIILLFPFYWILFVLWGSVLGIIIVMFHRQSRKKNSD